MDEAPTTTKPHPSQATIEALAAAVNARDHCITGQCALILQLQIENAALRQALAGAAKDD